MNIYSLLFTAPAALCLVATASAQNIVVNGNNSDWPSTDFSQTDPSGDASPIDLRRVDVLEQSGMFYLFTENSVGTGVSDKSFFFLDTDQNQGSGYRAWNLGADYLIRSNGVFRYTGTGTNWSWEYVGLAESASQSGSVEMSFPGAWIDNPQSFRFIYFGDNGGNDSEVFPDGGQGATVNLGGGSANLITNPGFENGENGWQDWGNNSYSLTNHATSGSRSLAVGTTTGGSGQYIGQITPGATYTLTANAFRTNQLVDAYIGINFLNAAGDVIDSGFDTITSGNFAPYNVTATAPAGATGAQAWVWKSTNSHWIFVDDFSLTSGAAAPVTATYEVTFEAIWSSQTHPNFPAGGHFSGLIGGTHNQNVTFWERNVLATPGIENMAETGSKSPLNTEVANAINAGNAQHLLSGGGIQNSPGTVKLSFSASQRFPLVSLVSMVAPSPDWFVGVNGLNLFQNGSWVDEVSVNLAPYDSGTDSGTLFTSPDADTNPAERIFRITGFPFGPEGNVRPLGTFKFTRIQ